MDNSNLPDPTKTIHYEAEHRLASVSVCTNVVGYLNPVCFVNEDGNEYKVVKNMMLYLEKIAKECYERLLHRYRDIFRKIEKQRMKELEREQKTGSEHGQVNLNNYYDKISNALDNYLSTLLVYGYNSAKYDFPIIRKHIVKYLLEESNPPTMVIKKGNSYLSLKTSNLHFQDYTAFLAPGFSYQEFLRAMDIDCKKFYWIYEHFTSLSMLNQTSFPKHEHFYSKLKQSNISLEEYNYCRQVWTERKMKSLKDLLIYYNNQDCIGFVEAIRKQHEFFKSIQLDIKSAISISGLKIFIIYPKCKFK